MVEYGFVEGEDYITKMLVDSPRVDNSMSHDLTMDMAKEIFEEHSHMNIPLSAPHAPPVRFYLPAHIVIYPCPLSPLRTAISDTNGYRQ